MVNHGTLVKIMANHDTWNACQDHGIFKINLQTHSFLEFLGSYFARCDRLTHLLFGHILIQNVPTKIQECNVFGGLMKISVFFIQIQLVANRKNKTKATNFHQQSDIPT